MIRAEYRSNIEIKKNTPYLACEGEVWGVFCEYLKKNLLQGSSQSP